MLTTSTFTSFESTTGDCRQITTHAVETIYITNRSIPSHLAHLVNINRLRNIIVRTRTAGTIEGEALYISIYCTQLPATTGVLLWIKTM